MHEDVLEILWEAETRMEQAVNDLPKVCASKLGLDKRAGSVWVDEDNELIIARGYGVRNLEYYGGFEYVDKGSVHQIDNFKIYTTMDNRVVDALDHYLSNLNEE